jgi:putative DNA primase/helicase
MSDVNMLQHALKYAQRGWPIFPLYWIENGVCSCDKGASCTRPAKHPYTPLAPNGLKNASSREEVVQAWWTKAPKANIAVVTGEDSGLVVLDADGQAGLLTLQEKRLPETIMARSGRRDGGLHYYFQHPGERIKNLRILGSNSGVDTRGDGGYIILPPSEHWSGNRYEWVNAPGSMKFAKLPAWVIEEAGEGGSKSKDAEETTDDQPEIISEGRNSFLTVQAGHLRRSGLSEDAMLFALRDINAQRCQPMLPDEEVVRIAANSMKWEPAANPMPRMKLIDDGGNGSNGGGGGNPGDNDDGSSDRLIDIPPLFATANKTDAGNAECFVEFYGHQFRYAPERGKWYKWTGAAWQEDLSGTVVRAMLHVVRLRHQVAPTLRKKERVELWKHCEKSESSGRLHAAVQIAGVLKGMSISITELDHDRYLLGTPNGILNLSAGKVGEFMESDPAYFISRLTDVPYDPKATCPLWEKTVAEIFNNDMDLVKYVQRIVGYSLTGDMREQAFFIFYGKGANGKSTFLGVLRQLLGDYSATIPFESFDADQRNPIGNDIAALRGKRFVVCIEAEHNRRLAEARIKSITGGDEISCRFLYGEYFSYLPQFKVIVAVNHRPLIRGDDHGIWRRVHIIPFDRRFEGNQENKELKDQLAAEMPGILNWALEGLREWHKIGLSRPQRVLEETEAYKATSDQIGRWIDDTCIEKPDAIELASKAYTKYKSWCEENNERPYSQNVWVQRLGDRNLKVEKFSTSGQKKAVVLRGLELATLSSDISTIDNLVPEWIGLNA